MSDLAFGTPHGTPHPSTPACKSSECQTGTAPRQYCKCLYATWPQIGPISVRFAQSHSQRHDQQNNSLSQSVVAGLQQDRHAEHQPLAVSLIEGFLRRNSSQWGGAISEHWSLNPTLWLAVVGVTR